MPPPRSRVLVVDDRDEDAFILSQLLDRAGATDRVLCRTAEDAIECVKTWSGPAPLAAFIDVRLPVRSGFDVLKAIRESEGLRSTVVILLSASDEPRNLGKALQLGADAYIVKFPLLSVLRDALSAIHKLAADPVHRAPLAMGGNLLVGVTVPVAKQG